MRKKGPPDADLAPSPLVCCAKRFRHQFHLLASSTSEGRPIPGSGAPAGLGGGAARRARLAVCLDS